MKADIKKSLTKCTKHAPLAYLASTEWNSRGFGTLRGSPDVCFCSYCNVSFQTFLRTQYESIDELNRSWGSDFKVWEAVVPVTLSDALKKNRIPQWIDHRRHADWVFADLFRYKKEVLRSLNPDAQIVADNFRTSYNILDSFSGVDYWLLLNGNISGGGSLPGPYVDSFATEDAIHLRVARNAMWHPDKFTGNAKLFKQRFAREPWKALLSGMHGYAFYVHYLYHYPNTCYNPILKADLTPGLIGEIGSKTIAHIRSGIDRIIFESSRENSGIAIFYSRASEHAATAWQTLQKDKLAKKISPPGQVMFYFEALHAAGYQFKALSDDQIAKNALEKGEIKMLILPFSQAISPDAVEQIRTFVENGGTLLADLRPGVADQHGNIGTSSGLDEVFGVQHEKNYQYTPTRDALSLDGMVGNIDLSCEIPDVLTGSAIKLTTANAMGKSRTKSIPALTINKFGRGQAILLNFVYPHFDGQASKWMKNLFTAVGLKPLFEIESLSGRKSDSEQLRLTSEDAPHDAEGLMDAAKEPYYERAVFSNGNIRTFGFWYSTRRGLGTERLNVTPPAAGHIYDLRSNEYLGWKEYFEAVVPFEDLSVYASVPYRIVNPVLSLTKTTTSDGLVDIVCHVQLYPAGATSEKHAVKFRLFAPESTEWIDFATTRVSDAGHISHHFVLPLNAPDGQWKIEVREAISGLSDTQHIQY